jgi:DNA-binding LacI/PurR family transcriptional regulator
MLPAGRPAAAGGSLASALAGQMAAAIAAGKVEVGHLLPPERELARRHRVGRVTVRGALARLIAAGIVESRPGVGHVVVRSRALATDSRPVGLVYRDLNAGESDCIRRFRSAGAGALVVAPATSGERGAELEGWIGRGQPVVLEGHPGHWLLPEKLASRCDQVDVDNRGGVLGALEYLRGLGHRRVGFLTTGPGEHSERLAAFTEGARELGLTTRRRWVLSDLGTAAAGARRLLRGGSVPTAVVCADDDTALEFTRAAADAGADCPSEVSVVGFGNESVSGPGALGGLTTVDYPREKLAGEIVRLLDEQFAGRRGGERVRIATRLVVRGSCSAPREAGATRRTEGKR